MKLHIVCCGLIYFCLVRQLSLTLSKHLMPVSDWEETRWIRCSLREHITCFNITVSSRRSSRNRSSLLWTQPQFLHLSSFDEPMWLVEEWTTAGVIGKSSPSDWPVPDTVNTITLCSLCWGQHGRHSLRGWWKQLIGQLISLGEGCHSPERRRSSCRAYGTMGAPPVSRANTSAWCHRWRTGPFWVWRGGDPLLPR